MPPLARNDNFWGSAARLDQYVYKVVGTDAGIAAQLETGELDLARVTPDAYDALRTKPNLNAITFPEATIEMIVFQCDPNKRAGKFLSDKAVRKSLVTAIDKRQIANAIYFRLASPLDSILPGISWAYSKDVKPRYAFRKAEAERLLEQSGYRLGSDGVRQKDGVRMEFELLTYTGETATDAIAQVLAAAWNGIGCKVTTKLVARAAWLSVFTNSRDFDVTLLSTGLSADPDGIAPFVTSRGANRGGINATGYANPQLDSLFGQAVTTPEQAKRRGLYAQAQDILADELPVAPILSTVAVFGAAKRVRGLDLSGFNGANVRPWFNEVWVSDGR